MCSHRRQRLPGALCTPTHLAPDLAQQLDDRDAAVPAARQQVQHGAQLLALLHKHNGIRPYGTLQPACRHVIRRAVAACGGRGGGLSYLMFLLLFISEYSLFECFSR